MSHSAVQFGPFRLDLANRRLSRGGRTVDLGTRYMDALILLLESKGTLVAKDRFMDEVWRGVPVTDEALTQAIRTLRRALGDSASAPKFIETVPKHGYRFIAPITNVEERSVEQSNEDQAISRAAFMRIVLAGIQGALGAGLIVGMLYGFIGAAQISAQSGGGALSLLLVLVLVSLLSAGVAGGGIAAGLAASKFIAPMRWYWVVGGGAIGGLIVGAFANLLGSDAFRLLFGRTVDPFAGAVEGLILGGAAGLAMLWVRGGLWMSVAIAAMLGLGAGLGIALLDGRMMAGSLQELVSAFPSSQFRLDGIGGLLGETGMGPVGRTITGAVEGAVFLGAMRWSLRGSFTGRYAAHTHASEQLDAS
ncbi:transcriptional regulator [Altererythrobacter sp. SALINAS58]|uniref:winged helix-turn-helix domain-containing protein n=1 Tax=Alteripontixanthobacter muriae TaxID=2705546 RepID=UPI001576B055|nr:transcriptional regulator [Alteripontixanthobacter muriae]NTZ41702.1 transcriptional regulator [Alteripontixanthobacter muriae]